VAELSCRRPVKRRREEAKKRRREAKAAPFGRLISPPAAGKKVQKFSLITENGHGERFFHPWFIF